MKQNGLTKDHSHALLRAKTSYADARKQRALDLLGALTSEFRGIHGVPEGVALGAAVEALLCAAASALFEIELTTSRMAVGRAHQKALLRLGLSRSEMRRSLQALGMIRNSAEARDDESAPPPGATDEERRECSQRYVADALAEEKSAAK